MNAIRLKARNAMLEVVNSGIQRIKRLACSSGKENISVWRSYTVSAGWALDFCSTPIPEAPKGYKQGKYFSLENQG
jgi:hypothetical protein